MGRKAGISGIVVSCGMQRVHSTEEHIAVRELLNGAALVAMLIQGIYKILPNA